LPELNYVCDGQILKMCLVIQRPIDVYDPVASIADPKLISDSDPTWRVISDQDSTLQVSRILVKLSYFKVGMNPVHK